MKTAIALAVAALVAGAIILLLIVYLGEILVNSLPH